MVTTSPNQKPGLWWGHTKLTIFCSIFSKAGVRVLCVCTRIYIYVYIYIYTHFFFAFVAFRASRCFKTKSSSHANSPSATGNQTASWMKKYCAFDGLWESVSRPEKVFLMGKNLSARTWGNEDFKSNLSDSTQDLFFHAWHGGVWMLPLSRVWHVSCFLKLSVMSHFALTSSFPDHSTLHNFDLAFKCYHNQPPFLYGHYFHAKKSKVSTSQ